MNSEKLNYAVLVKSDQEYHADACFSTKEAAEKYLSELDAAKHDAIVVRTDFLERSKNKTTIVSGMKVETPEGTCNGVIEKNNSFDSTQKRISGVECPEYNHDGTLRRFKSAGEDAQQHNRENG